jgi:hypothetical protein
MDSSLGRAAAVVYAAGAGKQPGAISRGSRTSGPRRSRRCDCNRTTGGTGHGSSAHGSSAACSTADGHSHDRNRTWLRNRSSGRRRKTAQHRTPGRRSSGPHSSGPHSSGRRSCTNCGSSGRDGTARGSSAHGRSVAGRSRCRSRRCSRSRSRRRPSDRTAQTRWPGTKDTTDSQSGRRTQGFSWKCSSRARHRGTETQQHVSPEPPAPRCSWQFAAAVTGTYSDGSAQLRAESRRAIVAANCPALLLGKVRGNFATLPGRLRGG